MWPFKCKEEKSENPFDAYFKVGDDFDWMGIKMRVTGLTYFTSACELNMLRADYIDGNGVIQSSLFMVSEIPALLRDNPCLSQRTNENE